MPRRRVAYYYEPEIGNFFFGRNHPLKPHRVRLTHELLQAFSLERKLTTLPASRLTTSEMSKYHADEYIEFLKKVDPSNCFDDELDEQLRRFNVGGHDCPVFDAMFQYIQIYSGGSIAAAVKLNRADCDVAINWAGGMHHARKAQAGGHCYVNDAVLAILELLRYHARVLYIDLDMFHGDGVEEAFYSSDRVMTMSFHKYGEGVYPGSGSIDDVGEGTGKGFAINVPLKDGIRDNPFLDLFSSIVDASVKRFSPDAIVMQCGAGSLAGDRVGSFNLTHVGHCGAVEHVCNMEIPTLLLGGGGSNVANTARCWARETVIAMGDDLVTSSLPRGAASSPCYEYFGPSYNLDIMPALMKDLNTPGYLQSLKEKVCAELDANAAVADPAPGAIASLQGGEDEAGAAGNSRKRSAAAAGLPPSGV